MARSNPDTYTIIPCVVKIIKLLIAELDNRLEADARLEASRKHLSKDYESEDGEDWEDVDDHSVDEFTRFDEYAEDTLDIEEIDETTLDQDDPMYNLDLKVILSIFIFSNIY
jgi:trans-2-enoyl-CoA reductase